MDTILTHLGHIGELIVALVPFFLWFHKWTKNLETTIGLTKQVATEHLPYVYRRLGTHDQALGLISPDHPNIGFIPNGSK